MEIIEGLKVTRPHLIDPLSLYERILYFENKMRSLIVGRIDIRNGSYPSDLIDTIADRFSEIFSISADILSPLKEALRFKQIDFLRLPFNEVPSFALPYHEEETEQTLFILAKPLFISLKEATKVENSLTSKGRCPVCHSTPSLSSISENEARIYYCSFCGFEGRWSRIGCPACQNRRGEEIEIIIAEEEKGLRLELCNVCKSYIKTFQRSIYSDYTPDIVDIISLPLDIIAQSKGYARRSPNPIGMRRIL